MDLFWKLFVLYRNIWNQISVYIICIKQEYLIPYNWNQIIISIIINKFKKLWLQWNVENINDYNQTLINDSNFIMPSWPGV